MQINLESAEPHAIQAYNERVIQINGVSYEKSLIVSKEEIISDLTIKTIAEIDEAFMVLLMRSQPKIIIIGHEQSGRFPPIELISQLSKQGIGMECMSIAAACRTYNVLLGEQRAVVGVFILKNEISTAPKGG